MNAKTKLILASLLSGITLASCGGNGGLKRADAESHMDKIAVSKPAAQTKVTYVKKDGAKTLKTTNVNVDDKFLHVVYTGDVRVGYGSNVQTIKNGTEVALWVEANKATFAYTYTEGDATKKVTYTSQEEAFLTGVNKAIAGKATYFTEYGKKQAEELSKFFKAIDEGDKTATEVNGKGGKVVSGATPVGHSVVYLANEKYTSSGEGNLNLNFDCMYPLQREDAENEIYIWENNLMTHLATTIASSNRNDIEDWTFGSATFTKPSVEGYEVLTELDVAATDGLFAKAVALA